MMITIKLINAKGYLRNFSKEGISNSFVNKIIEKINQEKNTFLTSFINLPAPKKLNVRDFQQIFPLTNMSIGGQSQ